MNRDGKVDINDMAILERLGFPPGGNAPSLIRTVSLHTAARWGRLIYTM